MTPETWQLKWTATHFLDNLATELYEDPADCLQELVRNGLCACMPSGKWEPKRGHVEIYLYDNHPLGPKTKTLVVLDHGTGFTKPAVELFCTVGRAIGDAGSGHSGAAQKRIGRFSGIALNKRCRDEKDISTGFFILTRTSSEGPVTMVPMIPERLETEQGRIAVERIAPNATELGPQRGIKGSFTAIVIPNSVFENYDQIRQALMWRLPRKKDLMYRLEVGNKQMVAPPLADKVVVLQQDGRIEAYIDRLEDRDDPNGGIWLTDADTGLRVASARVMGHQKLPNPLWNPTLIGDIFIPGLLANQGTSRSGLSSRYQTSAAWKKVTTYLMGQVAPKAKALLGDEDVFGRDAATKSLLSFVEKCQQVWGKPEGGKGGGGIFFEDIHNPHKRNGSRPDPEHPRGPQLNPRKETKPRAIPVKIGDHTYVFNKRPMNRHVYAEVDSYAQGPVKVIYINDGEYAAMPTTRESREEHILLRIFQAAGQALYPDDPREVQSFVGQCRLDFLKAK